MKREIERSSGYIRSCQSTSHEQEGTFMTFYANQLLLQFLKLPWFVPKSSLLLDAAGQNMSENIQFFFSSFLQFK